MNDSAPLPPSTRIIHALFDFAHLHRRRIVVALPIIALAIVLASGFYIVKKEELGLKTRFGKLVQTDIEPGLHYRVPFIEKAHIRSVQRIERHRVSSRADATDDVGFTILSGDTNLLEVDIVVQYRIGNLERYLHSSKDPRKIVSTIVRESLVDTFGRNYIDLIFTENRGSIEALIASRTVKRLEKLAVGVELVELTLVGISPIAEAVTAFRDVSDAIAERLQMISTAHRESERMLARSRGQADALRRDSQAKALERVHQAESAAGAFLALLQSYRDDPSSVAYTRYWQRMRHIFGDATLQAVNPRQDSTIDINMIDTGAAFIPASALASLPSGDGAQVSRDERPLLAGLQAAAQAGHRYRPRQADGHLFDGQFHTRDSERDHLVSAQSRSLIFDDPKVFAHTHVEEGKMESVGERREGGSTTSTEPGNPEASDGTEAQGSEH